MSRLNLSALKRPKPVRVRTHRYNTLRLDRPGWGDDEAIRLALSEPDARKTVARVLHHYLKRPQLSLDVVCSWPNRLLLRVGKLWLRDGLRDDTSCETLEEICDRLAAHVAENDEHNQQMKALIKPLTGLRSLVEDTLATRRLVEFARPSHLVGLAAQLSSSTFSSLNLIQWALTVRSPLLDIPRLGGVNFLLGQEAVTSCLGTIHTFNNLAGQAARLQEVFGSKAWGAARAFALPNIFRLPPIPKLFFPNYEGLDKLHLLGQEVKIGRDAVEESGFAFLIHLVGIPWLISVGRMNPRARDAILTRKMLHLTGSQEFEDELIPLIQSVPVAAGRWKPIKSSLKAHREREYYLSIPALLLQVEGLFDEMLYVRKEAIRYRGKPHMRDANGKLRRKPNGKFIPFGGLDNKIDHCNASENDQRLREPDRMLHDLKELFLRELVQDRNPILHGNRVAYSKAKFSAKLVWAIYILAFLLAAQHKKVQKGDLIFIERL